MNTHIERENNRYRKLLSLARMGWWEADFKNRSYRCSDFLIDLLDLQSDIIGFEDFELLIREDFRERIKNEFSSILLQDVYEQSFPVYSKYGVVWVHSKLGEKSLNEDGHLCAFGFLQCIDNPEDIKERGLSLEHVNNLLYQQNSISRLLLQFFKSDDVTGAIDKILEDILYQFKGGHAYIASYDWENRELNILSESVRGSLEEKNRNIRKLSVDSMPWWTRQIMNMKPIVLFNLDELPEEAVLEKKRLGARNIKSLMAVPMVTDDGVWGFMGIDMIDVYRDWSNEDYQWFTSIANIVSLCLAFRISEKKADMERLYLKNLYKHMPIGYVRMELISDDRKNVIDYRIVDANEAALEISGLKKEEIGMLASELDVTPVSRLIKILSSFDNMNEHTEIDVTFPRTEKIGHNILYSPEPGVAVVLFSDITESVKAHEALDRSAKILHNIYTNIPVGIELYDENGYLVDMNNKDIDIFGLKSKRSALGINIFENPNISDAIKDKLKRQEAVSFRFNYPFKAVENYYPTDKKGYIDLYTKVSILYDNRGKFSNYLFINIDNTEINKAYSRIAEFESSFSLISRFGKIGYCKFDVISCTGYGITQWFNNLGENESTPLNQIIGVYRHVHEEDRRALFDYTVQLKNNEIDSFSKELRVRNGDGWKWTRVNVMRDVMNNTPGKLELICVNYDITELKETERKLIKARDKAEESGRLKSAFLANMSHEIRTPLNAIVGFSELLMNANSSEEKWEFMNIVKENNELLLQLISDILDISKIEAGTFDFVVGQVNVNLLCEEIVRSLQMKVSPDVRLLFEKPSVDPIIPGDKNRINQIITNFVNNAIKFTKKGFIRVGYKVHDKELEFYVSDTGVGIEPDKLGTIFDRFIKLNNFVHGTGLGLSICKSLVEQMGGRIGVESKPGIGSRFWFTYPLNENFVCDNMREESKPVLSEEEVSQKGNRKPLILVAEDTDSNFLLISIILKKEYEIIRAINGFEVMRLEEIHRPDIILMDIRMPEMDGIEATYKLRDKGVDTPIIAVTAFAFDQDRNRILEAGCDDYISKPIFSAILKERIRYWLNERGKL
ncbi:ATP-binding protein [uncultured Coprobacter sp.]|uniref:ATP-binding protein n=1 Tax=uncultured Coprobacter sp. TaxID=1720550 RepID=UPI00260E3D72|nr:ATP-binding protein [uncultured Coprobacter sp.]